MEELLKMLEGIGGMIETEIRQGIEAVRSDIHEVTSPDRCQCRNQEAEELTPAQFLFMQFTALHSLVAFDIKRVIFAEEDKKTIVIFDDGTKQIATCSDNDVYSKETGVMICILKRIYGNSVNDMLNEIADEAEKAENGKSSLVCIQKKAKKQETVPEIKAETAEETPADEK